MALISITNFLKTEKEWRDHPVGSVFTSIGEVDPVREDRPGFYWNFSAAQILFQHDDEWDEWDSFTGLDRKAEKYEDKIRNVDWENYRENYGVCDNIEQILNKYPELEQEDRYFFVTLVEIRRENQPEKNGWRWHKNGEYIGEQESNYEYLYDENIDSVVCFHIYERVNKPRGTTEE